MQKFKCHKIIEAAKIEGINSNILLFEIEDRVSVTDDWIAKNKPLVGGYFVKYADGYTSYSPADAFEKGYVLLKDGNNFGWALEQMIAGRNVHRTGWNGADQFVCIIPKPPGDCTYKGFPMQDCFGIKNAQNEMQPGWQPSQGDLLATDWEWA